MKVKILLFLFIFSGLKTFADSAQPGVWGAGGTRDFTLLYAEDSTAYKKIQMKKEFVSVQLYKGYAVVKGEYWMYNTTHDTFRIKTGYPLNSSYLVNDIIIRTHIFFDSLSQLNVFVDSKAAKIISTPAPTALNNKSEERYENTNWYVWVTEFKPNGYTKIDVYFIVNTNNTSITSGYDRADYNGFIYILESGSTWKQPIEKGTVVVQLMDELQLGDIHGLEPPAIFRYNEQNKILKYDFTNLNPGPEDNIIITYSGEIGDFDFSKVLKNKQSYFQSIDKLSHTQLDSLPFRLTSFASPMHVPASIASPVNVIVSGFIAVVLFVVLIVIILIVVIVLRRNRRSR